MTNLTPGVGGETVPGVPTRFAPIGGPRYWAYWAGSMASWGGLAMADVLLLFLVFDETHSAIPVAYVGLAAAIPALAIGLPAGALADRYDRRRLLWLTAVLQAAFFAAIPLSLLAIGFNLPVVLAFTVALEAATAVFRPSANAILPSLVDSDSLDLANGVVQASTSVAASAGAAVAAFLIVVVGLYVGFGLTVAIFAIGGIMLVRLEIRGPAQAPRLPLQPQTSLLKEIRSGFEYVIAHRGLAELIAISVAMGFFVSMFSPFLVVYTRNALHVVAGAFGYLLATYGVGFVAGSLAVARLPVVRHFGRMLMAGVCACGLLVGALVAFPSFPVALTVLALLGVLFGSLFTGFIILVQRVVPPGLQGRYFSIDDTAGLVMTPAGIFVGGLVTVYFGIGITYAVVAAGLVVTGLVVLALRDLRGFGWDRNQVRPVPPHVAGVLPGSIPLPDGLHVGNDPVPETLEVRQQIRP